jgi:hypothetical protein
MELTLSDGFQVQISAALEMATLLQGDPAMTLAVKLRQEKLPAVPLLWGYNSRGEEQSMSSMRK